MRYTQLRLLIITALAFAGFFGTHSAAAQGKAAGFNVRLEVISEADGLPVIGATCQMTDYGIYAVSDLDGLAVLEKVPSGKATLLVQLLGYEDFKQEINVARDTSMTIKLQESSLMLEQVVVTATASAAAAQSRAVMASMWGSSFAARLHWAPK